MNGPLLPIPTAARGIVGQLQESKDSNIKPVTVMDGESILCASETSLQWTAPHLTVMYSFPYIRLSEPGAAQARDNSYP